MSKKRCCLTLLAVLAAVIWYSQLYADVVTIPGDVNRISYFTNFFYNYPAEDFVFYLNDRLLYSEKPDGKILENGIRNKLLMVMNRHKLLKTFIRKSKTEVPGELLYRMDKPLEFQKVKVFLKLMGLTIKVNWQGLYIVEPDTTPGSMHYFQFALSYPKDLQIRLNKTKVFKFKLKETHLDMPWSYKFLGDITGLTLDEDSLFINLLSNEQFSLLLGTLFRLSDAEIDFIGAENDTSLMNNWKAIYNDKKLLMGMFVLSNAIRVMDGKLELPGGMGAVSFWRELVGRDPSTAPVEFLKELAVKDGGKLNYLYLFSYFLPKDAVKPILFNFDAQKAGQILALLDLDSREKLSDYMFPELKSFSFYTLLYGLHVKNGALDFPGGEESWLASLGVGAPVKPNGDDLYFQIVEKLVEDSSPGKNKFSKFQKFISVYNKFYFRPELLNKETIWLMSRNYQMYNVLVDYIEKIPIKKPETIRAMFNWAFSFKHLSAENRALFSSLSQSLLEVLAESARYVPHSGAVDYDRLVMDVLALPLNRDLFYDAFFKFLKNSWKLSVDQASIDDGFANFILMGLRDKTLFIKDASYRFAIRKMYKDLIHDILESQEVGSLGMLASINKMLDRVSVAQSNVGADFEERLFGVFNPLPNPGISDNAPKEVRDRFKGYSKADLGAVLREIVDRLHSGASGKDVRDLVVKLKSDFLIFQLKDYLLAHAYAVNAKNLNIRSFLNPNLIRLHDFSDSRLDTPWSRVSSQRPGDNFMGFHLRGGLSRLNLEFASNLNDHLFGRNYIYNTAHIQAVLINALDFYPVPMINHSREYSSLLVQYGMHLIDEAAGKERLPKDLIEDVGRITTGFHYRKTRSFLEGKEKNHNLFFSETMNLAEYFFRAGKILDSFGGAAQLRKYSQGPLKEEIERENHRYGSIFYHTFGTLVSQKRDMFPQELGNMFEKGWVSGEMINEFKVNVGLRGFQKKVSASLSGQFLNHFLTKTCRRFYSQNHVRDYYSTYFVFDIFNGSYLNKTIKKLNQEGYLRIK